MAPTARSKGKAKPTAKPAGLIPQIPQPHGGALNARGTPGNRGGKLGGRPPDAFKRMMRELASSPEAEARIRGAIKNKLSPDWLPALKFAAEHGYGRPNQPVSGTLTHQTYEQMLAGTHGEPTDAADADA